VSTPLVGMVGGGQLARMTAQAAIPLGLTLAVLTSGPQDAAASTGAPMIGSHISLEDLVAFAERCDVLTFDHEHVPPEHLAALAEKGYRLHPGPDALHFAQDKQAMRVRLGELGVPVPAWQPASGPADVARFAERYGWPVVAKAVRGGYDGRGVWVLADAAAAAELLAATAAIDLLIEEYVPPRRELAVLVARSPRGEVRTWPLIETVQREGICVETLVPVADPPPAAAALGDRIATALGVTGVLAVELFERPDGGVLVNELAMRPHNSGHWSIEGSRTSQFEQHLRAVLDWPLGETALAAPAVAMANVIGGVDPGVCARLPSVLGADPALKVHLYGKEFRPGRKLGHVTALGEDLAEVRRRATAGAAALVGDRP
jgi:5-(carboxyamino)imidazole ribonucleotide synthase